MHVISASAAFNVVLPQAIRRSPVLSAILSARVKDRLHATGRALTLAIQGLLFATLMWLLLAAPALLAAP